MTLRFDDNEFTSRELVRYLRSAYGLQINGSSFARYNVNNWIRMGKLPEAYGGHKILNVQRVESFPKVSVLTLDGLNRDILNDLHLLEKKQQRALAKTKRPRKQRTELYYKILAKAGKQYTVRTKDKSTLPDNWKLIGIKSNQLKKISKRKPN